MKQKFIFFFFLFIAGTIASYAQYFGKNKPKYRSFDYKVYSSPDFEVYHYLENDSLLNDFTLRCEQWYTIHQQFFGDTLSFKNPVILYNCHGDFQQTNVTRGAIGVGLGGFTEGLKNRVAMPLSHLASETDHVLGHELVHMFQYNYLLNTKQVGLQSMNNIPLWMIEGMAEYLSSGSRDVITSMWLRDDLLNNSLPTIHKITTSQKYNPYRYGQAFWAFADNRLKQLEFSNLLFSCAQHGLEKSIEKTFKVNVELHPAGKKIRFKKRKERKMTASEIIALGYENLDTLWQDAIRNKYAPYLNKMADTALGKQLVGSSNEGNYNLSPVISPDGNYFVYFSEKELFSIDLYLASMQNGKPIKHFARITKKPNVDAVNFIESAGSWSPDSKYFAYSAYVKGKSAIILIDIEKGNILKKRCPENLNDISYLAWGPRNNIAFSALEDGLSNIYILNTEDNSIVNVTNNGKSTIQPVWSNNGEYLAYVQEELQNEVNKMHYEKNICVYELKTGNVSTLPLFKKAENLNPQFSPDDRSLYFLSDRDGFRNLYRHTLNTDKLFQCTNFFTGITGITLLSPAFSISKTGEVIYNYYNHHRYSIWNTNLHELSQNETEVQADDVDFSAALLPGVDHLRGLDKKLATRERIDADSTKIFTDIPYQPKFKLDYVTELNIGVSTGFVRAGVAGGSTALFSDIVGNNSLILNLNLNGTIYDFGGIAAYVNQKNRLNYGISFSHTPYLMASQRIIFDTIVNVDDEDVNSDISILELYRVLESRFMISAAYPLTSTMRFESGISTTRIGYNFQQYRYYYNVESNRIYQKDGKKRIKSPDEEYFVQTDLAFVFDNSEFGLTAPLKGNRSRLQVSKYSGHYNHFTSLVDVRKYIFKAPAGVAFRMLSYNRMGKTADKNIYNTLYLGYPWFVRGYYTIDINRKPEIRNEHIPYQQLKGSKMIVSNVELRIPFTGPEQLSLIKSRVFFTDLNLFFDAGLIWDNQSEITLYKQKSESLNLRYPISSAGVSIRINLFGYLIIEPYFALPFQMYDKVQGVFGINFQPGW